MKSLFWSFSIGVLVALGLVIFVALPTRLTKLENYRDQVMIELANTVEAGQTLVAALQDYDSLLTIDDRLANSQDGFTRHENIRNFIATLRAKFIWPPHDARYLPKTQELAQQPLTISRDYSDLLTLLAKTGLTNVTIKERSMLRLYDNLVAQQERLRAAYKKYQKISRSP